VLVEIIDKVRAFSSCATRQLVTYH